MSYLLNITNTTLQFYTHGITIECILHLTKCISLTFPICISVVNGDKLIADISLLIQIIVFFANENAILIY